MRKLIVITLMLVGFVLAGQNSMAVDKVEKKSGQTQTVKTPPPKVATPTPPKAPTPPKRTVAPAPPKTATPPPKKKYDDFIDKNHNGIDDRREKPGK